MSIIVLGHVVCLSGCGCQKKADVQKDLEKEIALTGREELAAENFKPGEPVKGDAAKPLEVVEFEREGKKFQVATKSLEEASNMMKSGNLDGAIRLVQRVQQENRLDPIILMQTSYLQAMIYHRQGTPAKRKEAMSEMLKQMEMAQKDPRFQKAHEEGKMGAEVIKESMKRYSKDYENN